ncbi:hypothetical protein Micbo1qcDRAFT_198536 [Microdochium bolleyi]|uniref:WSC domain-containing protein n=1 Tax=Microdochium bolleyi TaxID=196109 RepID=A0A136IM86_9PEZI|nr:hypothetical protein Micbo1qcDRAFT_198536 [Microdochium bolleyi]
MAASTRLTLAFVATTSLLVLPMTAAAGDWPVAQWDPETIPTCTLWETPDEGDTCEAFRAYWGLSAEQFSTYNPNVGTDCRGWYWPQSYCISDTKRDAAFLATATDPFWISAMTARPTPTPATTTHTVDGTPVPSPLIWKPISCYPGTAVLEKQISKGDRDLTHENCRARCWDLLPSKGTTFAGLRGGDECWCGPKLLAEYDSSAGYNPCNSTCSGNPKQQQCGGKDHMVVWGAVVVYGRGPTKSDLQPTV